MPILDIEAVRSKILEILISGSIDFTNHCRERMYLRRVQMDDLLFLLHWGDIEQGQEEDDPDGQVFRIIGTDVEEEPLTAVVKICDNRLICITVF